MKAKNNLINKQFGRLLVIEKDYNKSKLKNRTYYICQCQCSENSIISVRSDLLTCNKIKSCGCINKENIKNRKCCIENCEASGVDKQIIETNNKQYPYLCFKHYMQLRIKNKILIRTIQDKNEIIEYQDYAILITYNSKSEENAKVFLDLEDIELVKPHKWYLTNNGYIATRINGISHIYLHRFLLNPPEDLVVDHIDRNPLNNRKENLRICTQQNNNQNSSIPKRNSSGERGVYWNQEINKWCSQINTNGKTYVLGYFDDIKEASLIRKHAELELFGEFAPHLND